MLPAKEKKRKERLVILLLLLKKIIKPRIKVAAIAIPTESKSIFAKVFAYKEIFMKLVSVMEYILACKNLFLNTKQRS